MLIRLRVRGGVCCAEEDREGAEAEGRI